MKKNITINMFGNLYAIDEDACDLLQQYLDSMKRYFQGREGGDEIADDIEHHVAELLWQKKEQGIEAISINDVREIISQIGNAQEIDSADSPDASANSKAEAEAEAASASDASETNASQSAASQGAQDDGRARSENPAEGAFQRTRRNMRDRRLFRNPSDTIVGGVCSGLALYTGLGSPLMWRLAFVLVAVMGMYLNMEYLLLLPCLTYLLLLVIVSVPRTPEDRLRQQGAPVTPSSLNQQILNDSAQQQQWEAYQSQSAGSNDGCLSTFLKVVLLIVCLPILFVVGVLLFCLFVFVAALLDMGSGIFPYFFDSPLSGVPEILQEHAVLYAAGLVALLLVVILPIYGIYRLLRRSAHPERKSHALQLLILWLLCLVLAIVAGTSLSMNISKSQQDFFQVHRHTSWSSSPDSLQADSAIIDTTGVEFGFVEE